MGNEPIGIYLSGKVINIVYDMNVADDIVSQLKRDYPNKKSYARYL